VPRFAEIRLADDTSVRLELAPAGQDPATLRNPPAHGADPHGTDPHRAAADGSARDAAPEPAAHAPAGQAPADHDGSDLPEGFAGGLPVARGGAAALAAGTLRGVLRPLGPLLQEVHDAVSAARDRPEEMSVSFGVQIGQDLKLGIVGASGQASMTVSATWRLPAREEPDQGAR
jgi:Trypsin-co-occurring domain 1